ncbi:MAG: GEVED domain-containing protein [Crocinitomicaceae bacterium]
MKNGLFKSLIQLGLTAVLLLFVVGGAFGQLTGTKSIPSDYASLSLFVADLNTQGVGAGGVTLNVPAGYTETLSAQLTITATGTAANPIIIQKSGAGSNPVFTSYVGTNTPTSATRDGMLCLSGTDYLTVDGLDFLESASNTTETTCMEYAIGLFKVDGTNGAQNNTVKNCVITLNRLSFTTWTGTGHNGACGIIMLNCANAANTAITPTAASGSNSYNSFQGNTIQNVNAGIVFVGYVAPSPFTLGDQSNAIGGTSLVQGNSILNFGGAAAATNPSTGIFASNQWDLNCSYNTINNNTGSGVNHVSTLRGIFLNASSTSASVNCTYNNLNIQGGGTTSQVSCIENSFGSTAAGNTVNLNNNTITGSYLTATTGTFYALYSTSSATNVNILNNTISNINYSSAALTGTGSNYMIYNSGAATNVTIRNNTIANISRIGTSGGTTYCMYAGSGANQTLKLNTIHDINVNGSAGTAGAIYGLYTTTGIIVIDSNTVYNLINTKTTGTGVIYGLYNLSSPTNENYRSNTIYNLLHSGTGTVYGAITNTTSGTRTFSNNLIYNLSTGGNTVAGYLCTTSSPTLFGNKIYGLTASGTAATAIGLSITSLGTAGVANVYNNYIGNLNAPNTSGTATAPSVRGISITATTANSTLNVRNNTIYLNATSTGANFSTCGIYQTGNATATTASLTLNGNNIVNNSVPNGTGLTMGIYRTLAALANFNVASNRNNIYAGAPSATNLLYSDGTAAYQTLASYQTALAPMESSSVSENPAFLSTTGSNATYLHINPATVTYLESGAEVSSLITSDYDGDIRAGSAGYAGSGSAPDIGADEFSGISPAPQIAFTSISPSTAPQCISASARTVTVDVTTALGTITSVTLDYSFNGVAQSAITMTNTSGSIWTGTIPAASPANANVTWKVTALNSASISSIYIGTPYADVPLLGISAAATNSLASVCEGSATSVSASLVSSLVSTAYTTPSVSNPTTDEDFGSITIMQGSTTVLSNTSTANSLVGTLGTATGTVGAYSNFTSFGPHNMTAGLVYDFSIGSITANAVTNYNNTMAIFIDYNRNGSFADAGEMVYTGAATVSGAHTETGSFTVPLTAFNGLTRMRVVANEGLIASSATAPSYGEFEDYLLNITSTNSGGGAAPAISSISWSDGSTVVGTGSPLTVNPTATTTYTATITTLGCPTTASTVITALALPAAPIVTNSTHCGVQVPTASVATGAGVAGTNVYNWFSNPAGTTLAQPYNYGPLSTYYSNNFSSSTFTNSSIIGNASVVGNSLEMYPNALSQFGALTVNPSGMNSNKYAFDFKLITQGASASNMADGLSFSFGDDASAPVSATMNAENGTGTKLKVGFVTYTNGTSTQGIYLMYNSTTNEQSPTSPGVLAYNNTNLTWLNDTSLVAMTIDSLGVFNMTLDGVALFTNVQLPAAFLTANKSTWAYVFKGRSGGISSGTTIDDVVIKTSQVIPGNTTLVNPIGTTTMYYVSENGSNGCVSPLSTVVATATLPAPISTSGPDSIFCLGGTYSVTASSTASPAYTYTWTASTATGSGVATSLVGASQTITPTAGGTYSYYVTGQNGICTAVDTVVAVVNSTFPSAPIANPDLFTTCTGSTTLPISATGSPVVGSVTVPFGTGLSNYGTTATVYPATISGVPVGATITSAQLLMTNVNSINGSYRSEIRVATSGAYTLAPTQISTLTTSGTISPDPTITLAGFNATSGVINLLLTETYDDGGASVVDATFGSVSLLINYTLPSDVNWFANPTGGIALGSGATIESVGTSVLASPAANGTYLYYAEGAIPGTGGCVSTTRTTVTVKVESVNVTLTPIDVTCNGFANGSFSLGTVLCGTAPFTYSINGGAFGAIPTNLTAATYSVVVKDALDNSSSPVSVVVAQPAWTINNPIALAGTVCLNDLSEILTASSTLTTGPSASIVWYDAATGGNLLGSNTTLQAIGSSVLPTSTVTGTYNFYAQGTNAGCFSAARSLVPVTVYALPTVNAGVDVVICSNSATNAQTLTGSGSATSYTWNNGVTNAVPFNIASTTTYTVTGTDVNGCQNTDQVLVTVSALPVVNAGPDYTVCVGQNITLSGASAGNTLTWNNGVTNGLAFTVNTVGATTYTVTATNALGCQNTDQVIVNGNPTPTVSVSANQVVCAGSPVNFNVTTANGTAGFWSTNGLGTITPNVSNSTIAYTAALNDNATVQISYSSFNGCGSTSDTAIVTVNALPTVNAGLDVVACAGSNVSLTGTGSGTLSWDNGVVNSVSFPASVGATTYTLTVTNSNNCVSTDQVVVTGNALPVINAGSDVTICAGDEITLTATGASTYAWDNSVVNGVPFAPTVSGVYSVLGTDGNGCESTSSVNVTINALPGGVATASDEITINATATNATSYQWIDCATNQPIAGETSATFIATVNGSYAVITTNANGCSDTSNCVIVSAVGLGEMIKTIEANLYPNPTSGNVYVTLSNEESVNATIFDAQGKVVVVEMNVQNGSSINMTNLERGMYVVQLTSPRGSFVKRVVKN